MTAVRTTVWRRPRGRDQEAGAALLTVLMVGALLTALGATVTGLSVRNLENAGRDRQAVAALANGEAGIAAAIHHLRTAGVGELRCAPPTSAIHDATCVPTTYTDGAGRQYSWTWRADGEQYEFSAADGERYEVWIEPLQLFDTVSDTPGRYRIHSTGEAGGAPGSRRVQVDVEVAPFAFPLGVFADEFSGGGSGSIQRASVFSPGCIARRGQIDFADSIDLVYGIPAAAHSARFVTDKNVGADCTESDSIHNIANNNQPPNLHACNASIVDKNYIYDQDAGGGDLSGKPDCFLKHSSTYPVTSKIDSAQQMAELYDFNLDGLDEGQLDLLRTAAQSQGFYITDTVDIPVPLRTDAAAAAHPNPVLFYDLKGAAVGQTVDLNGMAENAWKRVTPISAGDAACTSRNVIIVVVNGNLKLNGNQVLTGAIFAMGPDPHGKVDKANGTGELIGTVYSKEMALTGTGDIGLDACFLANLPGSLLNVTVDDFREIDR